MKHHRSTILNLLRAQSIAYELYEHDALQTGEDAVFLEKKSDAVVTKNLLLRNKKGDKHWLYILPVSERADLKALTTFVGETQKLSLASEDRLWEHLRIKPGSVSALNLLYDPHGHIQVILDKRFKDKDYICCHPNDNTASIKLRITDWLRFIIWSRHTYRWF